MANDNINNYRQRRILEALVNNSYHSTIMRASENVHSFMNLRQYADTPKAIYEEIEHLGDKRNKFVVRDNIYYMLHPENIQTILRRKTDSGLAVIGNALNFSIANRMDPYTVPHPERRLESFNALRNFREALKSGRDGNPVTGKASTAVWFDIETLGKTENKVNKILGIYDFAFAQFDAKDGKLARKDYSAIIGVQEKSKAGDLMKEVSGLLEQGKSLTKDQDIVYEYISRFGQSVNEGKLEEITGKEIENLFGSNASRISRNGLYKMTGLTNRQDFRSLANFRIGMNKLFEIAKQQDNGTELNSGMKYLIDTIKQVSRADIFGGHNVLNFDIKHITDQIMGDTKAANYLASNGAIGKSFSHVNQIFNPNKVVDTLDMIRSLNNDQLNRLYSAIGIHKEPGFSLGEAESLYKALAKEVTDIDTHHNALTDTIQEFFLTFGENGKDPNVDKGLFDHYVDAIANSRQKVRVENAVKDITAAGMDITKINAKDDNIRKVQEFLGYRDSRLFDQQMYDVVDHGGKLLVRTNENSKKALERFQSMITVSTMGTKTSYSDGTTLTKVPNRADTFSVALGDPYASSGSTAKTWYELDDIAALDLDKMDEIDRNAMLDQFGTKDIVTFRMKQYTGVDSSFRSNKYSTTYMTKSDFEEFIKQINVGGAIDKDGNVKLNTFGEELVRNAKYVNKYGQKEILEGVEGLNKMTQDEITRVISENAERRFKDGSINTFQKGTAIRDALEEANKKNGTSYTMGDLQKAFRDHIANPKNDDAFSNMINGLDSEVGKQAFGDYLNKEETWLSGFSIVSEEAKRNGIRYGGLNPGWVDDAFYIGSNVERGSLLDSLAKHIADKVAKGDEKDFSNSKFLKAFVKTDIERLQEEALRLVGNNTDMMHAIMGLGYSRATDSAENIFIGTPHFLDRNREGYAHLASNAGITFNRNMSGAYNLSLLLRKVSSNYSKAALENEDTVNAIVYNWAQDAYKYLFKGKLKNEDKYYENYAKGLENRAKGKNDFAERLEKKLKYIQKHGDPSSQDFINDILSDTDAFINTYKQQHQESYNRNKTVLGTYEQLEQHLQSYNKQINKSLLEQMDYDFRNVRYNQYVLDNINNFRTVAIDYFRSEFVLEENLPIGHDKPRSRILSVLRRIDNSIGFALKEDWENEWDRKHPNFVETTNNKKPKYKTYVKRFNEAERSGDWEEVKKVLTEAEMNMNSNIDNILQDISEIDANQNIVAKGANHFETSYGIDYKTAGRNILQRKDRNLIDQKTGKLMPLHEQKEGINLETDYRHRRSIAAHIVDDYENVEDKLRKKAEAIKKYGATKDELEQFIKDRRAEATEYETKSKAYKNIIKQGKLDISSNIEELGQQFQDIIASNDTPEVKLQKLINIASEVKDIEEENRYSFANDPLDLRTNLFHSILAQTPAKLRERFNGNKEKLALVDKLEQKVYNPLAKMIGNNYGEDKIFLSVKKMVDPTSITYKDHVKALSNWLGVNDNTISDFNTKLKGLSKHLGVDKQKQLAEIYRQQANAVSRFSNSIQDILTRNGASWTINDKDQFLVKFGNEAEVDITSALPRLEANGIASHFRIGDTAWVTDLSTYIDSRGEMHLSTGLDNARVKLFSGTRNKTTGIIDSYMQRILDSAEMDGGTTRGKAFFAGLKKITKDLREAGLQESGTGLHEVRLNMSANLEKMLTSYYQRARLLDILEKNQNKNVNIEKVIGWIKNQKEDEDIDYLSTEMSNLLSTLIFEGSIPNALKFKDQAEGVEAYTISRSLKATHAGNGNYSFMAWNSGHDMYDKTSEGRNFIAEKTLRFNQNLITENINKVLLGTSKDLQDIDKLGIAASDRTKSYLIRHADEVAAEYEGTMSQFGIRKFEATTKDVDDVAKALQEASKLASTSLSDDPTLKRLKLAQKWINKLDKDKFDIEDVKDRFLMRTNTYEGGGSISGRFFDETSYNPGMRIIQVKNKDFHGDTRGWEIRKNETPNASIYGTLKTNANGDFVYTYGEGYTVKEGENLVDIYSDFTGDTAMNEAKRAQIVTSRYQDANGMLLSEGNVTERVRDFAKSHKQNVETIEEFMAIADKELQLRRVAVASSIDNPGIIKALSGMEEKHVVQINMENVAFINNLKNATESKNIINSDNFKEAVGIIKKQTGVNILEDNLSYEVFEDLASGRLQSAIWSNIKEDKKDLYENIRDAIRATNGKFKEDLQEGRYFMDSVIKAVTGGAEMISADIRDALKHGTNIALDDTWNRIVNKYKTDTALNLSEDEAVKRAKQEFDQFFVGEKGQNYTGNYLEDNRYVIKGTPSFDEKKLLEYRNKQGWSEDMMGDGGYGVDLQIGNNPNAKISMRVANEVVSIVKDPPNFNKKPTFGIREVNSLRRMSIDRQTYKKMLGSLTEEDRGRVKQLFEKDFAKLAPELDGYQIWGDDVLRTITETSLGQWHKGDKLFRDVDTVDKKLYDEAYKKTYRKSYDQLTAPEKEEINATQRERKNIYEAVTGTSEYYKKQLAAGDAKAKSIQELIDRHDISKDVPLTNEYIDLLRYRNDAFQADELNKKIRQYGLENLNPEEVEKFIGKGGQVTKKVMIQTDQFGNYARSGLDKPGFIWDKNSIVDLAGDDEVLGRELGNNRYLAVPRSEMRPVTPGSDQIALNQYQKEANSIFRQVKDYKNYMRAGEEGKAAEVLAKLKNPALLAAYNKELTNYFNNEKSGLLHELTHREIQFAARNKSQVYDVASLIQGSASREMKNFTYRGKSFEKWFEGAVNDISEDALAKDTGLAKSLFTGAKGYKYAQELNRGHGLINFAIASTSDIEKYGYNEEYFRNLAKLTGEAGVDSKSLALGRTTSRVMGLSGNGRQLEAWEVAKAKWLERATTEGIEGLVNRSPSDYQYSSKAARIYFSDNLAQGVTMVDSITATMMKNDSDGDTALSMMLGARTKSGKFMDLDTFSRLENEGKLENLISDPQSEIDQTLVSKLRAMRNAHEKDMARSMYSLNHKYLGESTQEFSNFTNLTSATRKKAYQKFRENQMDRAVNGLVRAYHQGSFTREQYADMSESWNKAVTQMDSIIENLTEDESKAIYQAFKGSSNDKSIINPFSLFNNKAFHNSAESIKESWKVAKETELSKFMFTQQFFAGLNGVDKVSVKQEASGVTLLKESMGLADLIKNHPVSQESMNILKQGVEARDTWYMPLIENLMKNNQRGVSEIDTGFFIFDTIAANFDAIKGIDQRKKDAISYIRESIKEGYLTTKQSTKDMSQRTSLASTVRNKLNTFMMQGNGLANAKEDLIDVITQYGRNVTNRYPDLGEEDVRKIVSEGFDTLEEIFKSTRETKTMSEWASFIKQPMFQDLGVSAIFNTGTASDYAKSSQLMINGLNGSEPIDFGEFVSRITKSAERNMNQHLEDIENTRHIAFMPKKVGSEMMHWADKVVMSKLGGWGKIALGLAAGVMAAGYVGGNPSAPSGSEARTNYSRQPQYRPQPVDYQSQLPPLSDSNLYRARSGPSQGYIININAQQPRGMRNNYAASLIQSAVTKQYSNNQININTNVYESRDSLSSNQLYDYLSSAL